MGYIKNLEKRIEKLMENTRNRSSEGANQGKKEEAEIRIKLGKIEREKDRMAGGRKKGRI